MTYIPVRKIYLLFSAPMLLLFVLMSMSTMVCGQYYGMKFSAHEFILDKRSGLDLTPEHAINIKGNLDLQFYVRFEPGHHSYFGYIFRLIVGDKNIDLINGAFQSNPTNLELILGDKTSKIAFHVPVEKLTSEWIHIRLELDFENQQITCHVNDEVIVDELSGYDQKKGFRLMFGAHSYGNFSSTDVPAMVLRDVNVKSDNRISYSWPLNQTEGTLVHSIPRGNTGIASNPLWLLKHHNRWNHLLEVQIEGEVRTTFDHLGDDLYILSKDSILIYNISKGSTRSIALKSPLPAKDDRELIYDTIANELVMYSLDNNYRTSFNVESREWSPYEPGTEPLTAFMHHNRVLTPDGVLLAYGGYGYHTYKSSLLAWNPVNNRFDSVDYKGLFHPRYLAASGYNPSDGLIYIIGGYGSESGKQAESPDYYYEILSYSEKENRFSNLFKFENLDAGFCFSNSVVFDDSNNMYTLYYPKYRFDNKLQLVKIPLDNPDIIELGDAIEYSFLDILSYADLHYSNPSNTLVAVTSYLSEESTTIKVHSIAFPPQPFAVQTEVVAGKSRYLVTIYIFIAIVLIVSIIVFSQRRKGKTRTRTKPVDARRETIHKSKKNSIILFGGFQVIDKEGIDITGQFTPLPKKLFLFIMLHSLRNNKGVSSNVLYETFWFDKSVESARNNRAVNIVKLKSLLEKLDSASISKETGYWKFDFDSSMIYIDFYEYMQIVQQKSELTREQIVNLLSIIENSPFLNNTNADWLDPFKSEISNDIIDALLGYIDRTDHDPEFLLHLTKCIFIFDAVSEEALKIQCRLLIKQGRHSLAKKAYSRFMEEYRRLYGEEYNTSFNQIIEKG